MPFLNTPLKFGMSWKFWRTQSSQQMSFHKSVLHSLKTPQDKNRRPLNYVVSLLITLVDSTPFLIYSRSSICCNFHPQSISYLQTYSLGFFLKQCDLEGCLGIEEQWMRTVAAKLLTNFKHLTVVCTFLLILKKNN